ncbi:MAG: radical SAM protein [Myxococcaceae bacterium]|nr:radical SAM protein [Myxococcaceae bacterium]
MRPTVSWNIVGGCNYRCSYCVQKHAPGLGTPSDDELDAALATMDRLPGRWEFKISGGEPFLLKRLPEVAHRLAAKGHLVSVLTNLSAPLRTLLELVDRAGPSLRTFSCSLHREETTEDDFLEKALAVKRALEPLPKATFVVNSVVVPGTVDVVGESRRRFEALGVKFYPQLMRKDGKAVDYDADDTRRLEAHFDDLVGPGQMNRGYRLTGRLCHAGAKYFIIHPRGDAFSCYPGKRVGDGHLGNVFDGTLTLRDGPAPCPYDVCPCTVPQNRGIIEGFGANGEVAPREAD